MKLTVPEPPAWMLDWAMLDGECPFLRDLAGCRQDPLHHAEGDVLVHTRMVAEAMAASAGWRERSATDRAVLFAAGLLHDIGKPACTRLEADGRVSSRGHSRRGELLGRVLLYRRDVSPSFREQVVHLVRHHQVPFFLIDREDARKVALRVSQSTRCDLLALLAEADARGRVCQDQQRMLDQVELFAELCREHACYAAPWRFPSERSRFLYFRKTGRDPDHLAFDDTRSEVVMMSGLPGAGKDTWLRTNLPDHPVVSLDGVRRELGISPAAPQGEVAARAQDLAREHLRAGRPFAFNATNLRRDLRAKWIELFTAYDARVRVVYVEAPLDVVLQRNLTREARVPIAVIEHMLERWEPPDPTEADRVEHVFTGGEG